MRYLERRVIHSVLLLIGVSVLCFLFTDLAPGSFFDEMKLNPQISAQTVTALKTQYGFDKPLPVRYVRWVRSVVRGEWGYSFAYNLPVRGLLTGRAGNTLLLTGLATLLSWLIAVPLGTWIASRPGRWGDWLCMSGTSLLLAIPELVLALAFLALIVRSNALPVGGMASLGSEQLGFWRRVQDLGLHLVVPVGTLVLASLPLLVRHVRASVGEALKAPFIQTARGHGLSEPRLLFRYALPAAANPLISLFGFSIGGLLSASLLVEVVTGWPGLGPLLLEASMAHDMYVVVGVVIASTVFMVLGNCIADVGLILADPRIRAE